MQAKAIASPVEGRRTFALILDTGDEFTQCLTSFAKREGLTASQFTGIGAFSSVVLGYFEWDRKEYRPNRVDEQVEVVSLMGDIVLKDGAPTVHAHVTVAKRDASAWGGHLLEGIVRPTLELIVTESPESLSRRFVPEAGIALIRID